MPPTCRTSSFRETRYLCCTDLHLTRNRSVYDPRLAAWNMPKAEVPSLKMNAGVFQHIDIGVMAKGMTAYRRRTTW